MATKRLDNITFLRNSTALGGIEGIRGGVTEVNSNYTTVANDFILVVTDIALTITIDAVTQNEGQWLHIKDATGRASVQAPTTIDTTGLGFDGQTKLFITSPYGGLSIFIDPTRSEIFTMPFNPVQNGTFERIIYKDQDATSPMVTDIALVTLPLGTTSPNEITIWLEQATMIPFVTADTAASFGNLFFSHRLYDGTNQVFVTQDSDVGLTITNGTNTYFTPDGLLDATQNYAAPRSTGQLRCNVQSTAGGGTPWYMVVIDFDSRGLLPGPFDLINIRLSYRNAQFLDTT